MCSLGTNWTFTLNNAHEYSSGHEDASCGQLVLNAGLPADHHGQIPAVPYGIY